jgi:phospholipase/lecithinase/hemolysin
MRNPWLVRTLAGLCLAAATLAAQAQSAIYVFGDSYSDVGNDFFVSSQFGQSTPPSPPYYDGRFSNGPLWIEHVASARGITLTPSEKGGTDYAFGGAELLAAVPTQLGPIPSVKDQVAEYLEAHGGKADPHALYVLTGGGNDILNAIGTGASPTTLGAQIGTTLGELALVLRIAGARHFLIPNLLNVGMLPAAAANPQFALQATLAANQKLQLLSWNPFYFFGVDILQPDIYHLFASIGQDTTHYGFTNIVTPCLSATLAVCADPDHTLFWDAEHPTEFGHSFLAVTSEASLAAVRQW